MNNKEDIEESVHSTEMSLSYGEKDGLKKSQSKPFQSDQVVIFLDKLPIMEVSSTQLQFPTYYGVNDTMGETQAQEAEQAQLDRIMELYHEAERKIASNQAARARIQAEIDRENRKKSIETLDKITKPQRE
jgi:ribosomal protein L21